MRHSTTKTSGITNHIKHKLTHSGSTEIMNIISMYSGKNLQVSVMTAVKHALILSNKTSSVQNSVLGLESTC